MEPRTHPHFEGAASIEHRLYYIMLADVLEAVVVRFAKKGVYEWRSGVQLKFLGIM